MNRREFVARAGAGSLGLAALPTLGVHAENKAEELYDRAMPDMLVSYLSKELNNLCAQWDRKRREIKTPEALESRNRFVRRKFVEMIGGFPDRTPLNPITVRVLKRDGYRIEVFMYQSRPNFWVTASLYVPTTGSGPFPGIISPCGHFLLARMVPTYQTAYLSLVKNGFVVLAYDPIGQGERRQYWNPETSQSALGLGDPVYEHSMAGQLLLLMGESLTQYRIWDGMRGIDCLQSRPEVDAKRIGCAGHSGGGTLTEFISLVDERVKCAVMLEGDWGNRWPVHYPLFVPLGPSDVEQNVFPAALYGIDAVDRQIAIAPRPLLSAVEHYSSSGFKGAAESVKAGYRLLGVPEKFSTVSADSPHAWTYKLRLATADWFNRWFYGRPGPDSEPPLVPEKPEDLYCTPDGSIRYSQQGQTICSLILKKQTTLPPPRPTPKNPSEVASHRTEMRVVIQKLLHYRKSDHPLSPRKVATVPEKGYRIEKMEFLSEPGIYLTAWVFLPESRRSAFPPILYFNEEGMAAAGMEFGGEEYSWMPGVLPQIARRGHLVIAVDVRGIGKTRPPHESAIGRGEFRQLFSVETAMAYMAWYMDRSLFGSRVADVQRSVDYALSRSDAGASSVRVIGKGMGSLWALYAAVLDTRIKSVVCHEGLVSYRSLTAVDRYLYGADVFILDVLNNFDLPQVAAAVAGRRLALLSPLDAMKQPVDIAVAAEAYRWAQAAYSAAGAKEQFLISAVQPDQSLATQYIRLLTEIEKSNITA